MELLIDNAFWMGWNVFLAFSAVYFGYLMLFFKSKRLKFLFFFLWLLFVPNTIYVLTDIMHLFRQLGEVNGFARLIVPFQYAALVILGVWAFIIALSQFEKFLKVSVAKKGKYISSLVFIVNFIIGFGIVIGRIQRTNSWEVFTNPLRVINDSIRTLTSPDLMLLVLLFGIIGNLVYFSARRYALSYGKKHKKLHAYFPLVPNFSWIKN